MPNYVIDAGLSLLRVKVTAGGFLSAFGHSPTIAFRDLEGEASFAPESPEQSTLAFRVRPATLEVAGEVKSSDRREIERGTRDEVLEVAKFPEILYVSDSVSATKASEGYYRLNVNGTLTLHGVKRSQMVPAQISILGDTLRAFGEMPLSQSAYRIRLASAAGGALRVKDEVNLSFEIVARRAAAEPKE